MHSKPWILPLLALSAFTLTCQADYELVWSDEFNQEDGSAPNPDYWNYNLGGGGWGNAELQYYTNRRENSRIENGNLVIEVRREPNYNQTGYNYTSARLLTQNKLSWTYGRIEARIKVPQGGAGLWPAFWTLGSEISTVGWPLCGEIDIMEYVSRQPNETFGTIHGPGYSGGNAFGDYFRFGYPVADDYHTYAVEWEPGRIRWFVDGMLYHQATPADVAPNAWVFDDDHFIILNVAVGGTFGGSLDLPNLTFPTRMLVDYVRVYQTDPPPPPIADVPGRVEAEDFNAQSGIRMEATTDTGGGMNIGWIGQGDWIEYQLNAARGGVYELLIRYASPNGTSSIQLSLDGLALPTQAIDTATGGWQNWQTRSMGEITLPRGESTLRLTFQTNGNDDLNINWLELAAVDLEVPESAWSGFPLLAPDIVDTGTWLGLVNTAAEPWIYLYEQQRWAYIEDAWVSSRGGWLFSPD